MQGEKKIVAFFADLGDQNGEFFVQGAKAGTVTDCEEDEFQFFVEGRGRVEGLPPRLR